MYRFTIRERGSLSAFCLSLFDRLRHKSDIKIIASDLNFGNIYSKNPLLDPKPLDQTAPELFSSYGMHQLIDIPTRVREHTISLVDLFFVSTIDNVKLHGTLPAIADHDGIFASFISIKTQAKPKSKIVFDYKNADEKGLIKYINEFDFDKGYCQNQRLNRQMHCQRF